MSREAAEPLRSALNVPPPRASDRPEGGPLPTYRTEDLFSGATEIRLTHAGAEYRLKITRAGKLILNK
jgi:hemin uptake protein HemP